MVNPSNPSPPAARQDRAAAGPFPWGAVISAALPLLTVIGRWVLTLIEPSGQTPPTDQNMNPPS